MTQADRYETMDRDDLEQVQVERLQATVNRACQNVAFYRESFERRAIDIEKIKSLADLAELPFTTKEDLRLSYPYGMFAVPLKDIVRIHSTSGTTGKPVVVGYTANDIAVWASLVARVLRAADLSEHDLVQIAFNYNLSSAGLGFHYGAEKLGASVVPSSGESVGRQVTIMRDYKTTALVGTPGYALHISGYLRENRIHPDELRLRAGLFGAESWSEAMRAEIEDGLHLKAYDNYGLTELMGPGVAFECSERKGLHVSEDHFIMEVIDRNTLKPLKAGEEGELVFTTITKQGFPLIRYRTGDISSILDSPCPCGRTHRRMGRVSGRIDDMIIVDGVNIFPSQIEDALLKVEGIAPHYRIILDREEGVDSIEVQTEVSEDFPYLDELGKVASLRTRLQNSIDETLGIHTRVTFVERKTIERSQGSKLRRVVDKRPK
ncbi:MAG: phenylacetate--CoA ligase [Treponema sp. GWB1_62_6]|nr:MAG: phenylacetate--CoA ligase [Treponema sp. GWC1_61_84]OHE71885.1 MAG: phenylacetate--CoA ligase [Treponema sp. RIFOXYC1_FULL_61_9]OHE72216.1 MAG: phenylacetate--CoA ligase [Treponema sp. GWB1_62_6]HCM28615.1 phenylacetate--CoA ligase [Treponema sp.]